MAGGHTLNLKQGPGPRFATHPERIRAGQLFFARQGPNRQRLTVKRVDGESVRVLREDGNESSLALDRLLARDEEGNGAYYRFHGWKRLPRGYRTEMMVAAIAEGMGCCEVLLPEWDPTATVELDLSALPDELRVAGAQGTCRADLASASIAGLNIHACTTARVKGLSRTRVEGSHPDVEAEGQEFRRRSDRKKFRLLRVDPDAAMVQAWNGKRVVRLDVSRLLERRSDGEGRHYLYLGGGVAATRRRRAERGGDGSV